MFQNTNRKSLGWLTLGGALAGAAAMFFSSPKGREVGKKLMTEGEDLWTKASEGISALTGKASELISGKQTDNREAGLADERTNISIGRGDSYVGLNPGADNVISRGDSALNSDPMNTSSGPNTHRGDSAEENLIH